MSNSNSIDSQLNVTEIRKAVKHLKRHEIKQFKKGYYVITAVAPKWLDIIWKGKMVQINSKGKIRGYKKKNKRDNKRKS